VKIFNMRIYSQFVRMIAIAIGWFLTSRFEMDSSSKYHLLMTSHGSRIYFMPFALHSLLRHRESFCVSKIFITIDSDESDSFFKKFIFKKLKSQGVEILKGSSYGPHSKYYHYLHNSWTGCESVMLFDDDMVYRKGDMKRLISSHAQNNLPACMRSYVFDKDNRPYDYNNLQRNEIIDQGLHVMATGVGGSLLSSPLLSKMKSLENDFIPVSKSNDDIWIYYVSVVYDIPFTQVVNYFYNPVMIPFTQKNALRHENVDKNVNSKILDLLFK
jgi:hypothetical protein